MAERQDVFHQRQQYDPDFVLLSGRLVGVAVKLMQVQQASLIDVRLLLLPQPLHLLYFVQVLADAHHHPLCLGSCHLVGRYLLSHHELDPADVVAVFSEHLFDDGPLVLRNDLLPTAGQQSHYLQEQILLLKSPWLHG